MSLMPSSRDLHLRPRRNGTDQRLMRQLTYDCTPASNTRKECANVVYLAENRNSLFIACAKLAIRSARSRTIFKTVSFTIYGSHAHRRGSEFA